MFLTLARLTINLTRVYFLDDFSDQQSTCQAILFVAPQRYPDLYETIKNSSSIPKLQRKEQPFVFSLVSVTDVYLMSYRDKETNNSVKVLSKQEVMKNI